MKFPKLEIENFLAITKAEINLADRGLVAIQGKNNADTSANSNGAGKSSIADALCWCWFGTTARGATGDDVINNSVGKGCRVSSTIIDGGVTYTATRHRKHKTGKNRFTLTMHDGLTETDLTKGTDKLTQVEADKIIGSSLDVFSGSIYAGQEKMPDLPAMTDKALKMLIEEAAGVTLLEEAYKKAREEMQSAQQASQHAQAEHERLTVHKANLNNQKATNDLALTQWAKDRDKRLNDTAVQVKALVTKVQTTDLEIKAINVETIDKAIKDIDAKIAGVSNEATQLSELEAKASAAAIEARGALASAKAETDAIDNLTRQLANLDSKVGTPCGECGRPITKDELSSSREALESKIETHRQYHKDYQSEVVKFTGLSEDANNKRDIFKAGMTDVSAEQLERQKFLSARSAYDAKVNERTVLLTQARGFKSKIETIKAEVNPYAAQEEQISRDLAQVDKDLADAAQRSKTALQTFEVEQEVVRVFSPAGVRARILDEVTPFLNAQTSKYLDTLSDGNISATWSTLTPAAKKGEYKEKFSIDVVNTTGGGSFKTLSGGEKRKVRIATSLALQDLVATRASKPIDLFIGDEIDDALDASGLERLMTILDEKAKERGSVFVISHNDLADFIRQTITIEKTPSGETKITELVA